MGISNDQTETIRAVVLLALLVVFVFGIDPILLWVTIAVVPPKIDIPLGAVYLLWFFLIALAVTWVLVKELLEDKDKTPPTTIRRIGGRIT